MRPRSTTLMPSSGATTSRSASMTSATSWETVSVSSLMVFLQSLRGRVLPRHPGKQRALDPGRVLRHARERHRVFEHVLVGLAPPHGLHQLEEGVTDLQRLADRLADHEIGHHRGAGLADRAAERFVGDVLDHLLAAD